MTPRNTSGRLKGINPIDCHVGARIRRRRVELGMSQEKLGEALGLTFQQVQKYERGANRVGASRLYDMGRILGVEIGWFFADMPDAVAASSPAAVHFGANPAPTLHAKGHDHTLLAITRRLPSLSPEALQVVCDLIRSLERADSLYLIRSMREISDRAVIEMTAGTLADSTGRQSPPGIPAA